MSKIRIVVLEVRESYYVANVGELETLIDQGYEIVSSCMYNGKIFYTLCRR